MYKAISDSSIGLSDVITDFVHNTDKISLADIDANNNIGDGDQAFVIDGSNVLSGTNNIRWTEVGSDTIVEIAYAGNVVADMTITLTGTGLNLDSGDFVL